MSTSGDTANINPIVSAYVIRSQNTLAPFFRRGQKRTEISLNFCGPLMGGWSHGTYRVVWLCTH